jgi:hypothetical protein
MKNTHLIIMLLLAGTCDFGKCEDLELTFPRGAGSTIISSALLDDTTGHLLAIALRNAIPKDCCRPLRYEPIGKFYCCDSTGPYTLAVTDPSLKDKMIEIFKTSSLLHYLNDEK